MQESPDNSANSAGEAADSQRQRQFIADDDTNPDPIPLDETETALQRTVSSVRLGHFPLRLNCPHCQNPLQICDEELNEKELSCPSCGSSLEVDRQQSVSWSPERLPKLGKFQLLEAVGRGAFGTVYRARDTELGRIVAVKIPRSGRLTTPADATRFEREARLVAGLRHRGIVPIYEVGQHESLTYIVSEFVEGVTLSDLLTSAALDFRTAVDLVAQAADALTAAHEQGVVHRDVKPSNLMLSRDTSDLPQADRTSISGYSVRLMDFGLARRDEGEITVTLDGQVLGTPAYMSPEQAAGESHDTDYRTDVYSLGAVLYLLLVGELPFRGNHRMLITQVLHEEPLAPRRLNDRIPRDLENITLKCLQKDRSRRYQSTAELAADLRRWLRGDPVTARPVGRRERTWRWCRRNPLVASFVAVVLCLMMAVTIVSTVGYFVASQAIVEAKDALDHSVLVRHATNHEISQERKAEQANRTRIAVNRMDRSLLLLQRGIFQLGMLELIEAWQLMPEEETGYDFCIRSNLSLWSHYLPLRQCLPQQDLLASLSFSPDNRYLAVVGSKLHVWDVESGAVAAKPINVRAYRAWFSPNGERLLTNAINKDGVYLVQLWDWRTGKELNVVDQDSSPIYDARFSPDGHIIAVGGAGDKKKNAIRLWNAKDGMPHKDFESKNVHCYCLEFDAGGHRLVTGRKSGGVRVWNVTTGKPITALLPATYPHRVAFSANGRMIAAACYQGDNCAYVWDAASGKQLFDALRHEGSVYRVAFGPHNKLLLTASTDRTARLWDLKTGKPLGAPMAHQQAVHTIDFNSDGSKCLTGGLEGTIRIWDTATIQQIGPALPCGDSVREAIFHPKMDVVYAGGTSGLIRRWDLEGVAPQRLTMSSPWRLWTLAYSPDSKLLAAGMSASRAYVFDTATGQRQKELRAASNVVKFAYSTSGDTMAAGGFDSFANLWNQAGQPIGKAFRIHQNSREITIVFNLSPDGKTLLTGSLRTFQLWNCATQTPLIPPWECHSYVGLGAFSPDGMHVVTDGDNGLSLQFREAATGKKVGAPLIHRSKGTCLSFSRDGSRLVLGGKGLRMWKVPSREFLGAFGSQHRVITTKFSHDGRMLAAGCVDGNLRLWDVTTMRPIGPPLPQAVRSGELRVPSEQTTMAIEFLPDDRFLLAASGTYWHGGNITQNRWHIPGPIQGPRQKIANMIRRRITSAEKPLVSRRGR